MYVKIVKSFKVVLIEEIIFEDRKQIQRYCLCLVCILANTPGGVKLSGLGAHACWVIIHVSELV